MNNELKELLTDIQDWMMENDYECGEGGSDIYQRISTVIKEYDEANKLPVKIQINGDTYSVNDSKITYEQVMTLIQKDPTTIYTVVYFRGREKESGTLWPGSKPALIKQGTSFTAMDTSNA